MEKYLIFPEDSIHRAIQCINDNQKGIALVIDKDRHLIGTITDGDIRRAILAKMDMNGPVRPLLERNPGSPYPQPVTAHVNTPPEELLGIMRTCFVRQIPLIDEDNQVAGLVTMDELTPMMELPLRAVVMAGGYGSRLRPLTEDLPKPMLPVGGRPLLEVLLEQLRDAGIRHVNITTHYRPEKITEYFGDGKGFGVELSYVKEKHPLGTGGALGLIPIPVEPLLVINGDVLTDVNIRSMLAFHRENEAELTMAVRQYDVEVPYGVVETEGARVNRLQEKPVLKFFVNAGIYLMEPSIFQYIPAGESFNMTDLIQWLLDADRTVISFPVREYWLDIGQHADYHQAQKDVADGLVIKKSPPKSSQKSRRKKGKRGRMRRS